MNLGFSKQINGVKTYFAEKIWCAIDKFNLITEQEAIDFSNESNTLSLDFEKTPSLVPKIHTIRRDEKNRWKVGNKIHFIYGNGAKERFQFAPVVECKTIQKITIEEMLMTNTEYCYVHKSKIFKVCIDNIALSKMQIKNLAINDGFESVKDFFNWVSEDFTGKIIGWTNYKY